MRPRLIGRFTPRADAARDTAQITALGSKNKSDERVPHEQRCSVFVGGGPQDAPHVQAGDTLETPAAIPIEASEQRMRGLADLGVLQSGLDAAKTAQARTSLEKMLCHQTAAAHLVALRFLARADDGDMPAVDVARLANTAVRLMEVSQAAVITLARVRNMGRQVVEVQHVHQHVQVGEGGQAVVAGSLKGGRGSRNRGGTSRK